MNSLTAKKVIRLRFRRLRRYFHPIDQSFDVRAIHDFRVEFKKLRAFLRLLAADPAHKAIKIPDSLHDMYRVAGAVRDLQLHRKMMEKESRNEASPVVHLRHVSRKLTMAKRELKKAWKHETLTKAQRKIEARVRTEYADNAAAAFVTARMKDAGAAMRHQVIQDNDLHGERKLIKDIIYNAGIFKTELKTPFAWKDWTEEKEKQLTRLAEKLGRFQDCCTSLTWLRNPVGVAVPESEKQLIARIRRGELKHKRELRDGLIRKLKLLSVQRVSQP